MKLYLDPNGKFVGTMAAAGGDASRVYHVPTDKNGLIELLNRMVMIAVTSDRGYNKAVSLEEILQIISVSNRTELSQMLRAIAIRLEGKDNG